MMADTILELIAEARRLGEGDCLHSEKGHFFAARIWRSGGNSAGVLVAILGAVIGTIVFNKWDVAGSIIGSLAFIIAAVSALTTLLNPQARAHAHNAKGNGYSALRGKLRRFTNISCGVGKPESNLAGVLEELAGEKDNLNQQDPPVPTWAYRLAKRGIKRGEADYSVDGAPPGPASGSS